VPAVSPRAPSLTAKILRSPVLILWGLFILLIPFYVVKGGLPQPGDALVLILVPVVLFGWNGRLERRSLFAFRALVWFTLWVTLVDLAWAAILNKWGFDTIFPVYYIYNAAIFLTALVLYERHRDAFITLTLNALFVSVVMQVTISIVYRRGSFRSSLFFDNPNQLGYYALLVACIIALTHRRARFGLVKTGIGLTACGYLALLSASRAAAAGIALLVVLQVFSNPRVIATATVTALVVMLVSGGASNAFDSLQERVVQDRSPNLSFFEQRGYDRIPARRSRGRQSRSLCRVHGDRSRRDSLVGRYGALQLRPHRNCLVLRLLVATAPRFSDQDDARARTATELHDRSSRFTLHDVVGPPGDLHGTQGHAGDRQEGQTGPRDGQLSLRAVASPI